MSIRDLDVVTKLELRKCVAELTDFLYEESEGFNEWYMTLNLKEEKLLDDKLFNILNRRINKHKFKKDE
jgi:hypothetical protein